MDCFAIESGSSHATFSIFQVHNREYFRRRMAHFRQHGFEKFWKSVIDLREVMRLHSKINFVRKFDGGDDTSSDYISFTNLISFVILCLFCVVFGVGAMVSEVGERLSLTRIRIRVGRFSRTVVNWGKFLNDCGKLFGCNKYE